MAKLKTPLPIFGIDRSKPGEYIAARATSNCSNIRVKRSLIEKRPGTEAVGDSMSERVQLLTELDTGLATHFVRIGPTKFEELNKTTLAWTSRASSALSGDESKIVSATFPLLSGSRIMAYTNSADAIRKWTGTGNDADLGGSPPKCKYLIYYGGYLIAVNITDDGSGNVYPWRVQWCDTGDPETWTGGNSGSQDLLEDSNDSTGCGYFGQYFTIHKENAIYIGYPSNTTRVFQFERKETGAGSVAHGTIISLPTGEQFFVARDGFRTFNGIVAPLIEAPMVDEIREFMNPEYAFKSWAKLVKELDEVWVGVPMFGDTEPSTVYKFNYRSRQVYRDDRTNCTACGDYKNTVGQLTWDELSHSWDAWTGPWDDILLASLNPIIVFGTSGGVTTRQYTGSDDAGSSIDGDWKSKSLTSDDFGLSPGILMEWNELNVVARGSGTLSIMYSTDDGNSWNNAGSIELDSEFPDSLSPQIVYFDAISDKLTVRARNNVSGETFSVKEFFVNAVPREEPEV